MANVMAIKMNPAAISPRSSIDIGIKPSPSAMLNLFTAAAADDNASTSSASASVSDNRWLDLDDSISVPTQTLDEIMAERSELFDEEIEMAGTDIFPLPDGTDSLIYPVGQATGAGSSTTRHGHRSATHHLKLEYRLENPILLRREESMSHQLAVAMRDRPNGGYPTAIAVSRHLLAVGTSRALVLIFHRRSQKLLQFVRRPTSPQQQREMGSVSCMDFSPTIIAGKDSGHQRLAVGFSRGQLLIYDCRAGAKKSSKDDSKGGMKMFEEPIQSDRGLIHVHYVTDHHLLLVDSGGSVYELNEKAKSREPARCIFTGCKGEVVNISVFREEELVILSTLKQILLLSVRRRGGVVAQLRLAGPASSPPLVDYNTRLVQVTNKATSQETHLCLARGREVRIFRLGNAGAASRTGQLQCPLVKVIRVEDPLVQLKWLDDFHLLAMNSREILQLIDVHRGRVVAERESGPAVGLVYNSSDYKALSTGGNVSEAMACLADQVAYQSMARLSFTESAGESPMVYMLGQQGVFKVERMDQVAQMDSFVAQSEFTSALLFATDIYTGRVVDQTATGDLRERVSRQLHSLILQLLNNTMDGLPKGNISDLVEHYRKNIMVLQQVCVATSHFQMLYDEVYRRVEKDLLSKQIFLDQLEELVMDRKLDSPPPSLVRDYLCQLLSDGNFALYEQSVTKLPVESLDLHQVITTCRANQLFDGLIYVMCEALRDYRTPMEEMFAVVTTFAGREVLTDLEVEQGNRLLLYLSCCLAGRSYPYGSQLPDHYFEVVPLETYKYIIQLRRRPIHIPVTFESDSLMPSSSSSAPSSRVDNKDLAYPNLRVLLKFDTAQFLNVIYTCVDAPIFSSANATVSGRLKRLVDILIGIVELLEGEERHQLACALIPFLVGLLQQDVIPADAHLYAQLVERVLEEHGSGTAGRTSASTQHAITELTEMVKGIEEQRVLQLAMDGMHLTLCSHILSKRGDYVTLVDCIMQSHSTTDIFPAITHLLRSTDSKPLRRHLLSSIPLLNSIDSKATAQLVMSGCLLEYLRSTLASKIPFDLVENCFKMGEELHDRMITGDELIDEALFKELFEGLIKEAKGEKRKITIPTTAVKELDGRLLSLLRKWDPLGSRTDFCLNLAVSEGLSDCEIHLLVARGFPQRAFDRLLHTVGDEPNRWKAIMELAKSHPVQAVEGQWLLGVFETLLENGQSEPAIDLLEAIAEAGLGVAVNGVDQMVEEVFKRVPLDGKLLGKMSKAMRSLISTAKMHTTLYENLLGCIRCEMVQLYEIHLLAAYSLFAVTENGDGLGMIPDGLQRARNSTRTHSRHECAACGEEIVKSFLLFNCGHSIHLDCGQLDGEKRCPCESRAQCIT